MRFRIKQISYDSFVYALVSTCLCGISLQLLQANLDNGTAGGMSTRGFINTGNFTCFFHEDI